MQSIHALTTKLCAAARLGVEVILPLAAHQYFPVLGDLEALCVGFVRFHGKTNLRITNATNTCKSDSLIRWYW